MLSRRIRTKRQLQALLNRNGFSDLSELAQAPQIDRPAPLIHGLETGL
jgi:hypothetical protein